jgi:hypothetical protein
MWRRIAANSVILTVCNFCTYMLCLWAYAGAFATCDIKSVRRARTVAFISLVWSEGFRMHADLTRTCTQCRTAWCPLLFWQRWLGSRIWTGHPGSRLRPGWSSTMRGSLGQIPWPLPTGVS